MNPRPDHDQLSDKTGTHAHLRDKVLAEIEMTPSPVCVHVCVRVYVNACVRACAHTYESSGWYMYVYVFVGVDLLTSFPSISMAFSLTMSLESRPVDWGCGKVVVNVTQRCLGVVCSRYLCLGKYGTLTLHGDCDVQTFVWPPLFRIWLAREMGLVVE